MEIPYLLDRPDKIANLDLVYDQYGRVIVNKMSTHIQTEAPQMHRFRRLEGGAAGHRPAGRNGNRSGGHELRSYPRIGQRQRRVSTSFGRAPLLKLIASLAAVTLIGSAVPAIASATSVITISGATASFPLVQLLAHKYSKLEHNKVSFHISQGGAQIGVNDVAAGRVTIGDVSRDPLPTDPTGLDFYPIAKYAICVVTNKANT